VPGLHNKNVESFATQFTAEAVGGPWTVIRLCVWQSREPKRDQSATLPCISLDCV